MQEAYLEVTFRHGETLAAYYYLPRESGQQSSRCRRVEPGLVIDLDADDKPIGIEITAPKLLTLDVFNRVLRDLGQPPVPARDLAPLHAA